MSFFLFSLPGLAQNTVLTNVEFKEFHRDSLSRPIDIARFYKNSALYSVEGNLFYGKSQIDLLNSVDSDKTGLRIYNIVVIKDDFYLLTDLGVFRNYQRIFSKEPCYHLDLSKKQIFISCQSGIYTSDFAKEFENYNWHLDSQSPTQVKFFTLDKTRKSIEFASNPSGFYYHHEDSWLRRSLNSMKLTDEFFNFSRFYVHHLLRSKSEIYIGSQAGMFMSSDKGLTWQKINKGLEPNPQGRFEIYEIKSNSDNLYLSSSNGLYISDLRDPIVWHQLKLGSSKLGEEYSENIYSIDFNAQSELLFSNSMGQIFWTRELELEARFEYRDNLTQVGDLFLKLIKLEPSVAELQKSALSFAGIPTGIVFDEYKRQARLRNFLPELQAYLNRDSRAILELQARGQDDFTASSNTIDTSYYKNTLDRDDSNLSAGLKFTWQLGNIIYDPEINNINTSARITANVRENILNEVTQIYYNRRSLLYQLLIEAFSGSRSEIDMQQRLKFSEYSAQLDARTGSGFMREDFFDRLKCNFPEEAYLRIAKIYEI